MDDIWNLLRTYNFNFNIENHRHLICLICGQILKNAHVNVCGCRYCYECISNYLSKDKKYCPGYNENCNGVLININNDLVIDDTANKEISKLSVNCPISSCTHKDELITMFDHINNCHQNKCPFIEFGCTAMEVTDQIDKHINMEFTSHIAMLLAYVNNMKESMNTLKNDSREKDIRLMLIHRAMEKIQSKQNEEIALLRSENDKLTEENKVAENTIETIQNDALQKQTKIIKLQQTIEEMQSKINTKTTEICNRLDKYDLYVTKIDKDQSRLEKLLETIDNEEEMMERMPKKRRRKNRNQIDNSSDNNCQYRLAPFEWRIESFSDKLQSAKNGTQTAIYSDYFYSHKNGYKMRLKLYPNGDELSRGDFLSIFFCIASGEFDDSLTWPMMGNIVIRLVDQMAGITFLFEQFNFQSSLRREKTAFMRPSTFNENNVAMGSSEFVKLDSLINDSVVLLDDSLLLRCSVDL